MREQQGREGSSLTHELALCWDSERILFQPTNFVLAWFLDIKRLEVFVVPKAVIHFECYFLPIARQIHLPILWQKLGYILQYGYEIKLNKKTNGIPQPTKVE